MDQKSNIELPLEDDLTLSSERHAVWKIVAMESDMLPSEVAAVSAVRLRLLGAAAIATEVMGERASPEVVTETLRQIHEVARTSAQPWLG